VRHFLLTDKYHNFTGTWEKTSISFDDDDDDDDVYFRPADRRLKADAL